MDWLHEHDFRVFGPNFDALPGLLETMLVLTVLEDAVEDMLEVEVHI